MARHEVYECDRCEATVPHKPVVSADSILRETLPDDWRKVSSPVGAGPGTDSSMDFCGNCWNALQNVWRRFMQPIKGEE